MNGNCTDKETTPLKPSKPKFVCTLTHSDFTFQPTKKLLDVEKVKVLYHPQCGPRLRGAHCFFVTFLLLTWKRNPRISNFEPYKNPRVGTPEVRRRNLICLVLRHEMTQGKATLHLEFVLFLCL